MNSVDDDIHWLQTHSNPRFGEVMSICRRHFGMERVGKGSHRVFKTPWPGDPRVNIQDKKGTVARYQVRQVIAALDKLRHQNSGEEVE